jgi:MFS family permease
MPHILARYLPAFLAARPGLALFALSATAVSGFGQTFFVSILGGEIRQAFDLSHTVYGSLYSGATLCSALLLLRLGPLVDTWTLPRVTILALAILGAGCLLIGTAPGVVLLGMGFVCIRLGGQGMMSHIGMTTAARYFSTQRGRAVALAAAGFPRAEAVLPAGAAVLLGWMNWRLPWISAAFFWHCRLCPCSSFWPGTPRDPKKGARMPRAGEPGNSIAVKFCMIRFFT